jgi:hypothetical protein
MSIRQNWERKYVRDPDNSSVASCPPPQARAFAPLTEEDIRLSFAAPAMYAPILSLSEAAELVKLRPQTLRRKVSEGLFAASVVRGKPLRFWRDRLVAEVMS